MTKTELFNKKYELLKLIGRGTTKQVWKAKDTLRDNRIVALNIYSHADGKKSREALERIARQEAIAETRAGRHPNIAELYHFHVDPDTNQFFFEEEYIEGDNLANLLNYDVTRQKVVKRITKISRDILRGLEHLHVNEITHGDVKLENIIISKDRAVITDLGSSVLTDRASSSPGAMRYQTPEAIKGMERTPASDMWQFGVLLYKALTGQYPFKASVEDWTGASPNQEEQYRDELRQSILRANLAPPRSLNKSVPKMLDHLIMRCLKEYPDQRPTPRQAFDSINPWGARQVTIASAIGLAVSAGLVGLAFLAESSYYNSKEEGTAVILTSTEEGHSALYRIDTSMTPHEMIAPNTSEPAVSRDGRWLAYVVGPQGERELVLRSLETNDARTIYREENLRLPLWSPDSQKLAVQASTNLEQRLLIFDQKGNLESTDKITSTDELRWHPNGTYLSGIKNGRLYIVQPRQGMRWAREYPDGIVTHAWAGKGLLFFKRDANEPPGYLWLYKADQGGTEHTITKKERKVWGDITKVASLRDDSGFWCINYGLLEIALWDDSLKGTTIDVSGPQFLSGKQIIDATEGKNRYEWFFTARTEDLDKSGKLDAGDNRLWRAWFDAKSASEYPDKCRKKKYLLLRGVEEIQYVSKP